MERNADESKPRPQVGLGIYILNEDGKVLLGQRKSSHGKGEFTAPGGHLEFGESFEDGVKNEAKEETGIKVNNIELFDVQNNLRYIKSDNKHYITLSFTAKLLSGIPKAMEPQKCEAWNWYSLDNLPSPLAEYTEAALKKLKNNEQRFI